MAENLIPRKVSSNKNAQRLASGTLVVKFVTKTDIVLRNAFGYNPDHVAVEEVVESENQD